MAAVLVIDDDPLVRSSMKLGLEKNGHHVSTAENGGIGIRALKAERFDIVVTDIIMPTQEGLETIIEIQRHRPGLPILAMSGGSSRGQVDFLEMARKMGAVATLKKPFSASQLQVLIEAHALKPSSRE